MALVNAFYQNTAINNIQFCQVYPQKKYNTVSGEVHIIIKHINFYFAHLIYGISLITMFT